MIIELSIPQVNCVESGDSYGKFVAEPIEPGFGVTLGNSLRRVLLSSLPGAAVTWIKIEGLHHEFTPIPHVKEDVIEFILNVKDLRLHSLSKQPGSLFLEAEGEGRVCAGDIKTALDFEIANPELHLATLDSSKAKLYVEFNVELGSGYLPAKSAEGLPMGALPVDAIFSPVRKVNFSEEPIMPGQEESPERLILEVWTDGTISPREALNQSAEILINQISPFKEFEVPIAEQTAIATDSSISPDLYNAPLEELNLSARPYNSLRRSGVFTVGQLLERSQGGLPILPGLGSKSRDEVEAALGKLGFPIGGDKCDTE